MKLLARAQRPGVATTHEGIEGQELDVWPEIGVVFDATSAARNKKHSDVVTGAGKVMIDSPGRYRPLASSRS